MTVIAFECCGNMVRSHADGLAGAMTRSASTQSFVVIHKRIHWRPDGGAMTGFAEFSGADVVEAFAGGNRTVMTFDAGLPHYGAVIKGHIPGGDFMA